MIEIIEYKESWVKDFREIGSIIRNTLGELAVRVDHIGSTSVPDLAAKDVIDVQLTVASFENFDPIRAGLESAGFIFREGTNADHQPSDDGLAGTSEYDPDWEKRYFKSPPEMRKVNLHVRATGRANQRYALLFRDYLRQHPDVAAYYGKVKYCLAQYHANDTPAYVTIKDPVCDLIMHSAEKWAVDTSWQLGSTDA